MTLTEYQEKARKTRRPAKNSSVPDPIIPLLGLAGETGQLLSEYKKQLRDGGAHTLAKEKIMEELGDLLWYVAETASIFGVSLEEAAAENIKKTRARFGGESAPTATHFDDDFEEHERFPRTFDVRFVSEEQNGKNVLQMYKDGKTLGSPLTDNAYEDDGYRFHDVFHLACVAVLGWSPVIRALPEGKDGPKRKRKSKDKFDEVEDGGRATAIEEGISALVFSYAEQHKFLDGVNSLDYDLLRTIKGMTRGLEVSVCTMHDWEVTILNCYKVWRQIKSNGGGTVRVDMDQRELFLLN